MQREAGRGSTRQQAHNTNQTCSQAMEHVLPCATSLAQLPAEATCADRSDETSAAQGMPAGKHGGKQSRMVKRMNERPEPVANNPNANDNKASRLCLLTRAALNRTRQLAGHALAGSANDIEAL